MDIEVLKPANDNNPLFYVYVWRDASGQPFYVGKGRGKRAYDVYDRSPEFMEIHRAGKCTVEIVDEFILESQALAHEVELIAKYGRRDFGGVLVNKTDGGDGCSGHVKSPESIALWRAKNVGRKRSPEVCAKISAGKVGYRHSDEARAKMSAATRRRFENPDERDRARQTTLSSSGPAVRAKIAEAQKKRLADPDVRARLSAAQRERMADPAARQRLSVAMTGKVHKDETRDKISKTTFGVPKSAQTVESMRLAQRMKPPRGMYKGVSQDRGKWRAIIYLDGRNQHLGTFSQPEEAARAYDAAAVDAWGLGNCYLNMPHANDNENRLAA